MKYIWLIILLVFMGWTWSLATSERSFRLDQHKRVEAGVEEDIRAFIKRKYPATSEIYCQQLFTEVVHPGRELIARFRCISMAGEATSPDTEQIFEGHLRLKSDDGFQNWDEVGGEIRSPEVRFIKGIEIKREAEGGGQ